MNLLLLHPHELDNNIATISDHRFNHVKKVLKSAQGDKLKAGIINGLVGSATITDIDDQSMTITFNPENSPPQAPQISLILALPRPKAFRRILFSAVSIGVKDIYLINSWRVEKSYWESPYITDRSINSICLEALSQSKDTIMPNVTKLRFFTQFFETELSKIPSDRKRYIAHPYAERSKPATPAIIAVGPEGGFIEKEINTFITNDFTPISLTDRVLTSEHFVPFMLGSLIN